MNISRKEEYGMIFHHYFKFKFPSYAPSFIVFYFSDMIMKWSEVVTLNAHKSVELQEIVRMEAGGCRQQERITSPKGASEYNSVCRIRQSESLIHTSFNHV